MDEKNKHLEDGETDRPQQKRRPVKRKFIEKLRELRELIMKDRGGKPFEEDSTELLRKERAKRTEYLMQVATGQYGKDPYAEDTTEEQPKNGI
jgi:hypothetical protein